MPANISGNESFIEEWMARRCNIPEAEAQLHALGLDREICEEHLQKFKKRLLARRQYRGFVLMSAGAILGFISCVLTLVNPWPQFYSLILYGLTSAAIFLILAGLYLVVEQ